MDAVAVASSAAVAVARPNVSRGFNSSTIGSCSGCGFCVGFVVGSCLRHQGLPPCVVVGSGVGCGVTVAVAAAFMVPRVAIAVGTTKVWLVAVAWPAPSCAVPVALIWVVLCVVA